MTRTYSIPFTFVNGNLADADEVNWNTTAQADESFDNVTGHVHDGTDAKAMFVKDTQNDSSESTTTSAVPISQGTQTFSVAATDLLLYVYVECEIKCVTGGTASVLFLTHNSTTFPSIQYTPYNSDIGGGANPLGAPVWLPFTTTPFNDVATDSNLGTIGYFHTNYLGTNTYKKVRFTIPLGWIGDTSYAFQLWMANVGAGGYVVGIRNIVWKVVFSNAGEVEQ